MTSIFDGDDLERRLTVMLRERAAAVEVHSDPDAALDHSFKPGGQHSSRRWMLVAAVTIVVLTIGLWAVAAFQDPDSVQTDTVPPTPVSTHPATTSPVLPVDSSPATLPATTVSAAPVASVVTDTKTPTPVVNGWVAGGSYEDGGGDIYLVRPGEDARRLELSGSDTTDDSCPVWSPDGTRLLFGRLTGSSDTTVGDAELVIVPVGLDGAAGAPTVIAVDGFDVLDGFDAHPCGIWAPDGRWVALVGSGAVWVVDTRTGAIRHLPDLRPSDLEWRPGTDQLAMAGDLGTNRGADYLSTPISIYSVSTGELHQLGSVRAAEITWSPDGSTLAYKGGENDPKELWLVDADGANERLLVADTGDVNHGIGPVWSPAGDRIVYQRLCCGGGETHEVVLVNVADATETVIEPLETGGWYPYSVTWSPDGTTLLYTAWSGSLHGVIVVPADTPSDATVLTDAISEGSSYSHRWVPIQMWGRQPG